jgi:hypothetical protein
VEGAVTGPTTVNHLILMAARTHYPGGPTTETPGQRDKSQSVLWRAANAFGTGT